MQIFIKLHKITFSIRTILQINKFGDISLFMKYKDKIIQISGRYPLFMAKANGYIIAKEFQRQGDNFQVSMDISPDNRTLAFGYGPMIKLVSINTEVNYWFQDRKVLGKLPILCKETNQKVNIPNSQRVVRDLKWNISENGKNYIGVAMGESAFVYDVEDIQNPKTPEGFSKVFQSDDVMRQGDYPTKFVWYPNSKDIFLCTSSKTDQIVVRDLRQPNIVSKFNGQLSQSKNEQKIEDLKFNPTRDQIFATISKYSTVQIFDIRKSNKSISKNESAIQNFKSNLLDWESNGQRLATVFGGRVNLWKFNGENLMQEKSFQHKNAISDFKWLRKHPDYLLVSEMQENIVYGYSVKRQKHDIEILMDPRHSGLKKFITDRNQELVLGLINFEDSKKNHHEMIAVFIDYKSSQPIWSKTKFSKPNQMGLDNELLFAATKIDYHNKNNQVSFPLIFKEVQSSAKHIENESPEAEKKLQMQKYEKGKAFRRRLRGILEENRHLRQQIQQKQSSEMGKSRMSQQSEQIVEPKSKLKKSTSIQQKCRKSTAKNHRSLQKSSIGRKDYDNFSSQSQQQPENIYFQQPGQWITTYREQVQYLDKNYRIQLTNQTKGENICIHNSRVASSIGKSRCAEFWKYIYYFAFPEPEQKYNLAGLYEDKVKVDVFFKQNKIIGNFENKGLMIKKTEKYNIQKLIQNLVDENELQTAVMASIMIRNKDPSLLTLEFIQPFLVCYKELLKAMGLTLISTNLSFLAKLNQAVSSSILRFQIPIGCGQCYRKFSDQKCTCLQVCVLCGQPLRSRLVVGCKICGHMVHANQCQKWIKIQNKTKCPYQQCKHECFQV